MFKRPDEVATFINYLEEFILAVIQNQFDSSIEAASHLNRKRAALESYLCEQSGISDQTEPEAYKCPDCGSDMKERRNRESGNKFYGCIKFPNCRGTRDENGLSKEEREERKYRTHAANYGMTEKQQQSGFSFNREKRNPVTEVSPPKSEVVKNFNPFAK